MLFTPSSSPPKVKIAIMRSTSIGDVVLATACIDLLRRIDAPVEIYWIGRNPSLQLISSAFPQIKVMDVDPENSQYMPSVLKFVAGVHMIVDLQVSMRSRAICRSIHKEYGLPIYTSQKNSLKRGQMVVSSRLRGRRKSLPEGITRPERFQFELMTETVLRAMREHLPIEQLDSLKGYSARPVLPTSHEDELKSWQKELKFGQWIAIAPGAAHETKRAPQELFVDILQHLKHLLVQSSLSEQSVGILFVGNEADRERALEISDRVSWTGSVLNLAGKLSLWESALAIREVVTVIANDSSLCHIGEAVGTPSTVLFGPTVEAFGFSPWRKESRAFSSTLGCRPCSKHGKISCRYQDKLCFKLLPAGDIARHVSQLLISKNSKGV